MTRPRVVVAGLGDSGVLTAIRLARHADVVGISSKPGLVSGQELGLRLSRPDDWARQHRVSFDRYQRLDRARTVHGTLTGVDLAARAVSIDRADGTSAVEGYDVLVISTGVANGFWRRPELQSAADIDDEVRRAHRTLADAGSVAVVGGGAAAVGSAANLAARWPDKKVDLYFPGERALPMHHRRVWAKVRRLLVDRGVGLHPGHRAVIPDDFACDRITHETVQWSTGQPPISVDAALWAVGRVQPNTGWLPSELLDGDGFVQVGTDLGVPGHPEVFAIGDVAATDPLRASARNRADRLLAGNIRARLKDRPLRHYRPPRRRWGSVVGIQRNGLTVFTPTGGSFRFPRWSIETVLQPWIVRRGIYKGVRAPTTPSTSPPRTDSHTTGETP